MISAGLTGMSATADGPTGGWSGMATADDIAPRGALSPRRKRSTQGFLKLRLRTDMTSFPPCSVSWSKNTQIPPPRQTPPPSERSCKETWVQEANQAHPAVHLLFCWSSFTSERKNSVPRSKISQANFPDSKFPQECVCGSACLKLRPAEPACDTSSRMLCFGPAVGARGQVVDIPRHS